MIKSYNLQLNNYNFSATVKGDQEEPLGDICAAYKEKFLSQVHSGVIEVETVKECLCGSADIETLTNTDRLNLPFGSSICRDCGLIFTTPRMSEGSLKHYYEKYYHPLVLGKEILSSNDALFKKGQGEKIYKKIKKYINKDNKKSISVHEIGAGTGSVLSEFRDSADLDGLGVDETGTEYSQSCIDVADSNDVNVIYGDLEAIVSTNKKYDVVILSHVFEHFVDLGRELKLLSGVLSSNGVVYVEVPGVLSVHKKNIYDFSYNKYRVHAHMYDFSLSTLCNVFQKHGYKLVDGNEEVEAVFIKDEDSEYVYVNDYDCIMHYLNFLEQNRTYFIGKAERLEVRTIQVRNRDEIISDLKEEIEDLKHQLVKMVSEKEAALSKKANIRLKLKKLLSMVRKVSAFVRGKLNKVFLYFRNRLARNVISILLLKLSALRYTRWMLTGKVGQKLLSTDYMYPKVGINIYSRYRFGKLIKHFRRTHELDELKKSRDYFSKLQGKYKGKRCFIIGNGPSLNQQDLTLLKNEFTIGSNYIYKNYDKMGFLPTIFTIVNYLVAEQRIDEINKLNGTLKVFPFFLNYCVNSSEHTFFLNSPAFNEFSTDINQYISWQSTVTFFNMQLAYYLGFDEVYLIGVDNNYIQPDSGKEGAMIKQDNDDPNHFSKDYFRGLTWQKADTNAMEYVYLLSGAAYEKSGRKLYNATHGGRLEIFERVEYESLFDDLSMSVAQPFSGLQSELGLVKPLRKKLVLSINPDLKDTFGHFYHYDARIKNALPCECDYITLSNKGANEELLKKNKWIMPVFGDQSWTLGRVSSKGTVVDRECFKVEFLNAYLNLHNVYDEIVIYFYTGSFVHAEALMDLSRKMPGSPEIHVNLFWEHFNINFIRTEKLAPLVAKINSLKSMHLYVDSQELGAVVKEYVPVEQLIWPMFPVSDLPEQGGECCCDGERNGKVCVVFPGALRLEKGYDLSLAAVENICSVSDKLSFRLRIGVNGLADPEITSMQRRIKGDVEFVGGVLSDADFSEFIMCADIIVLPYRVSEFSTRTSGVMTDSIILGKPVIAAKGTWMGNIIDAEGNGETFSDGDVSDLVEKIYNVSSNLKNYQDSCARLQKKWSKECNVNGFVRQILCVNTAES